MEMPWGKYIVRPFINPFKILFLKQLRQWSSRKNNAKRYFSKPLEIFFLLHAALVAYTTLQIGISIGNPLETQRF